MTIPKGPSLKIRHLKTAICDDESAICRQIEELVKRQKPDCDTEVFSSAEDLLREKRTFDIIILDIQMDGINGIEAAKILRSRKEKAIIIFITGIKEYVFEAFDVWAFHYLLKPIEEEKFAKVFARAAAEAERKKEGEGESFFIKSKGRTIILNPKEILYMESQNRMVIFHTTKENLELYCDMGQLEKRLGGNFYRCHRGYIVNMGYIAEYGKDSISLTNGETIYLSRRKYKEFVETYMDYLRNGGMVLESL